MKAPLPSRRPRRSEPDLRSLAGWLVACTGLVSGAGLAQPALLHHVAPGDTLSALAETYGGHARHWPLLQRLNRLDNPNRLQPGTRLRLPAGWTHSSTVFVEVEFVQGEAHTTPPGGTRTPLARGMRPGVGSLIEVGDDSTAHLRLSDGSVMQLTPGTRIRLNRLRSISAGITDVHWSLEQGRVENRVSPSAAKGRRFEIRTPYAVASVRGTEFAVTFAPEHGASSEVFSGSVELRHARGQSLKLGAGQGTRAQKRGLEPSRALPHPPALAPIPDQVVAGPRIWLPLPAPPGDPRWRVRITPADAPEQVLRDVDATGPRTDFAALPPGTYSVWVQARDRGGLLGPAARGTWTVRGLPPPPLYVSPAIGATLAGPAVELLCSRPEHATAFHLQIATTSDFSTLVHDQPALPECRFAAMLPPGQYHWRVATITRNAGGEAMAGVFSEGSRFEVRPPPPGAPRAGAATEDGELQLHWDSHPGWTYRVQVASDAAFGQMRHDSTTAQSRLALANWPAGTYFARVQAIDTWGQHSPFSPVQTVKLSPWWQSGSGLVWRTQDGYRVNGSVTP